MDYGLIDITYRSRLTLLNMLQARGYNITPYSKFSTKEIEMMIGPNMLGKALRMDLERPEEKAEGGGVLPESVLTIEPEFIEKKDIAKTRKVATTKTQPKKKQAGGAKKKQEEEEESESEENNSSSNTNNSSSNTNNSNNNSSNTNSNNNNSNTNSNNNNSNNNNSNNNNSNTNSNNNNSNSNSNNNSSSNTDTSGESNTSEENEEEPKETLAQAQLRERKEAIEREQKDYTLPVLITRCVVMYTFQKIKGKIESYLLNNFLNREIESELRVNPRTTEMILVVNEPVVEVFHAEALHLHKKYGLRVRFFENRTIVNDPTQYAIVPKHEKLSEEEVKKVMKEHYIQNRTQLPIIRFHEDMQARWLGLFPGDIVKITRGSPSAGEYIIYRVCFP